MSLTTHVNSYAFNAWIPLITYNTEWAPRFLVGNITTVALIVCAAATLTLAVYLQRRDAATHLLASPAEPSTASELEEELVGERRSPASNS